MTGYDVVELLGFGATGEVWLARETASGESVALKRLRTPRDLAARDRLRREAAVLSCVDHPHVVRLRTVVGAGDDLVLVLDHAGGGSLAGLLAARRLTAGEIVTVAVPLAGALAAVHARGLVHGDVTPANVLFTSDGRPLLSDLGVCQLVGERQGSPEVVAGTPGFLDPAVLVGEPPGPAADVHGLAAVCFAALTGRPPYDEVGARLPLLTDAGLAMPPALVAVIEAALDPDPHRRPSADELAVAVFESCPAQPVHLRTGRRPSADNSSAPALTHEVRVRPVRSSEPAAVARPRRRRHGRERAPVHRVLPALRPMRPLQTLRALPLRPAVGMLLVVCGVSMAVLAGVVWAGSDGRGSAAAVGPARERATRVDWSAVLAGLDQTRSAAFAAADADGLAGVYAAGSPALVRDKQLLDQLRASGHTARGVRLLPTSIHVVESTDHRVVLRVVDVMPPYELVAAKGGVSSRPGRAAARWTVTLMREGPAWQVYDVGRD